MTAKEKLEWGNNMLPQFQENPGDMYDCLMGIYKMGMLKGIIYTTIAFGIIGIVAFCAIKYL